MFQLDNKGKVKVDNGYLPGDPFARKTPYSAFHPKEKGAMRRMVMGRQEAVKKIERMADS